MKIALLVPNENIYSETFVRQHIKLLEGEVLVYHGAFIAHSLAGKGLIVSKIILNRYFNKTLSLFFPTLRSILRLKALGNSFINEGVEVVFCEFGITGAEVVDLCRRLKLPLIVHFHGMDISNRDLVNAYKGKYLKMFGYSSKIIGVSNLMKEMLVKAGAPVEKIVISRCGPSSDFYNNSPAFINKHLVSTGRFVEKKAPHITIQAFNIVLKTHSDAKLILCGDGPLLQQCMDIVNELGIQNAVIFFGIASPDEIKSLFESSMMYVQHSVTAESGDMEGTPVAIMEACAASLPVVSTYHAGIQDVIINAETGILVEEFDIEGMALGIIKLLDNPELAKKMGQSGRKNVYENFSLEKHIDTLNGIIESSIWR